MSTVDELNVTMYSIYANNMKFFKQELPSVYNTIATLSMNINSGICTERYSLEFVEGYFDIMNLADSTYYYATNTYEDGEKRASQIDLSKNGCFDLLYKDNTCHKLSEKFIPKAALPLVKFLNQTCTFYDAKLNKIYKQIFIGAGIGTHIHEMYKKFKPAVSLIVEPDTEIFRLSMFVVDYTIFNNKNSKLFISVGDDIKERESIIRNFFNYQDYMNYIIKYYTLLENYNYITDEISQVVLNLNPLSFSYDLRIQTFSRTIKYVNEGYKFLSIDKNTQKCYENAPYLILSAGPSYGKNINFIRKHQKKFIIIAIDTILGSLEKNCIKPDIVVSIDPFSGVPAAFNKVLHKTFLRNTPLIFVSHTDREFVESLEKRNIFFWQAIDIGQNLGYSFGSPNVGTFAMAISVTLGAKEIFLLGNDAAFDQETGEVYSAGGVHDTTYNINKINEAESVISHTDIIEVRGNFMNNVKTTRKLLTFKTNYEGAYSALQAQYNFRAYNLSNGVYINNFIPLKIEDIKIESFNKLNKYSLIDYFNNIAKIPFSMNLSSDINTLSQIIVKVKTFNNKKVRNKNEFLEQKLELILWILDQNKKMTMPIFGYIFIDFISLINLYVNFALNTNQPTFQKVSNLNRLKHLWAESLKSLIIELKLAAKGE